jgi:hypothetical protein
MAEKLLGGAAELSKPIFRGKEYLFVTGWKLLQQMSVHVLLITTPPNTNLALS